MLSEIDEKSLSSRDVHSSSTFLAQVFHRAAIFGVALGFLSLGAQAQTVNPEAYSRVFLQNGRALQSYGEYTLLGDRVAFVLPIGDPRARVELQLVSVPTSAVDMTRTARYAEGGRARAYAATRGPSDYSALLADVSLTLAEIEREADRARRLTVAGELRARLLEWPPAHYSYRLADLRRVLENLDQVMNEIQRELRQPPSVRPSLRAAPDYDVPLPPPTAQESLDLALVAAAASDAAGRDAIQRIVRSMTPASAAAPATAATAPPKAPPVLVAAAPKAAPAVVVPPPKAAPAVVAPPPKAAPAVVAPPPKAAPAVVAPPPKAAAVVIAAAPKAAPNPKATGTTGTTGTSGTRLTPANVPRPKSEPNEKTASARSFPAPVVPVVPEERVAPVAPAAAPPSMPVTVTTRETGLTVSSAPSVLAGLAALLLAGGAAGLVWRRRKTGATGTAGSTGTLNELTPAIIVPAMSHQQEEVASASTFRVPAVSDAPVVPVVPVPLVVPVAPVVPVVPVRVLEVGDVRDARQYGYHFVEGVVRNVSDRTLHFVEVVVDWCAPSGEFFTRETALIGLDALAPGGTSAFKVLTRANPSMTKYSLVFQSEGATLARFRPIDRQ